MFSAPAPFVFMLTSILLVCLLLLALVQSQSWRRQSRYRRAEAALLAHQQHTEQKDALLDYVLRYYSLHARDPFVALPGFDEKRCHHCHYPISEGHAPSCIWQIVRPVSLTLYSETKAKA